MKNRIYELFKTLSDEEKLAYFYLLEFGSEEVYKEVDVILGEEIIAIAGDDLSQIESVKQDLMHQGFVLKEQVEPDYIKEASKTRKYCKTYHLVAVDQQIGLS